MSLLQIAWELGRRKLSSAAKKQAELQAADRIAREVLGQQKLVAVDIGAANGLLPHWQSLAGIAEIYQIEPRSDACRELEQENACRTSAANFHVVEAGLSEFGGPTALYVSNAPTGSSLFRLDPSQSADCGDYVDQTYLFPIVETKIQTTNLKTTMDQFGESRIDMVKLDVQGAELPILRGLDSARLDGLLGVELEVGLHDFFPQEIGFAGVVDFMRDHGLELFDVRVARVHRPYKNDHGYYQREIFSVHENTPTISARIWEFDAVFFRRKSILLDAQDAAALRRMMVVYITYNFFSEAYSLAEKACNSGIFSDADTDSLKALIVDLHRRRHWRSWLASSPAMERWRRYMYRIAPRSAPRWCQHMYQEYPNG